jgi:transaldolase/glucose-6-phosphate isomerase
LDLKRTLCIVASKSGTTTEPNAFGDYFWAEMQEEVGNQAGEHFVAITDPNSSLHKLAKKNGYRHVFLGRSQIGGRFSALSPFGLVPAALMGIDLEVFLNLAKEMVLRCQKPVSENPGITLGVILGVLAKEGRDKVTLVTSPQIWDLGAWLEQLIAESTGKEGVGIVPIDQEDITHADAYGSDRVFVHLRLQNDSNFETNEKMAMLKQAGHPVVEIDIPNEMALGAEFFRWEVATAVAGSILEIHPFNQPNVQESKDFTTQLTSAYEKEGELPKQTPALVDDGIAVFADSANSKCCVADDFQTTFNNHLARIQEGDYVAICAYLDMREEVVEALQELRHVIRDRFRVATTLGFGPRFLHSTGQLHKGGANTVVILQLTSDHLQDLPIPGRKFTFGVLKDAQAMGDALALSQHNRRALRVHFQSDLMGNIKRLVAAVGRL